MDWLAYQLHRTIWAFKHDGGVWVQGFAAVVTAFVIAVCSTLIKWLVPCSVGVGSILHYRNKNSLR
jgi:hypothetical protein